LVKNKWDLLNPDQQLRLQRDPHTLCISASNGTHLDLLRQRITELLPVATAPEPPAEDAVIVEDPTTWAE
jgi:50S ribosomal subunit-associated GTPase HflX